MIGGYDVGVTETVLVVDDEEAIAEAVRARLESEGYRVLVAGDGPQAIGLAAEVRPDLVVLDLMLPGMDGLEVCKEIQRSGWVPVLMLTARTEEADKVAGFAVGADDYLTKPFSLRELAVRVKAILRRVERIRAVPSSEPIERGALSIDPARRRVSVDDNEVALTPLEFEILLTMAREPGVVFTREQLMDRVWGYRDYAGGRVVDSHVARIRRKLAEAAPFQLVRDEDEALLRRELFQGGFQLVQEHPARIGGLRSGVRRREQLLERTRISLFVIRNRPRHGRRLRPLLAKSVDDPVSRHPEQPGADFLDGLHQAVRLHELEEDVLHHVLHVLAVGHALPDEVPQPALLAFDRFGDSPVLLAHHPLEDQDLPPPIDVDG